jgi:hypothetical protein
MRKTAFAALALACTLPAQAEIVTFEFTGVIAQIREFPENARSRLVVQTDFTPVTTTVGDTFKSTFSFDTATVPYSSTATAQSFDSYGNSAPASTVALSNGLNFSSGNDRYMSVHNDIYDLVAFAAYPDWQTPASHYVSFWMFDDSGTALSSTALPGQLHPDMFYDANMRFSWQGAGANLVDVRGDILSITRVAPVPEPATYGMFLAGIGIVGAAVRRRQSA